MAHSEFTTIKCTVQKLQDTNQSCDVKAIEEFNKLINKYFFSTKLNFLYIFAIIVFKEHSRKYSVQ